MATKKAANAESNNVATVLDSLRAKIQQDWTDAADGIAQGKAAGEILGRDFVELLGLLGDKQGVEEFAAQTRVKIAAFRAANKALESDDAAHRNAYMSAVYNPMRSVKKILSDRALAKLSMSRDGTVTVSAFTARVTDETVKARKAACRAIGKCATDDTTRDLLLIAMRELFIDYKFSVTEKE